MSEIPLEELMTQPVKHAIEATGNPGEIARCARDPASRAAASCCSPTTTRSRRRSSISSSKKRPCSSPRVGATPICSAARDAVAGGRGRPRPARRLRRPDRRYAARVRNRVQRPVDPQGDTAMGVSKNLTVAIYGKGGAGKSFLTSMVAQDADRAREARAADGLRSQARQRRDAFRRRVHPDGARHVGEVRRRRPRRRTRSPNTSSSRATASTAWSSAARNRRAAAAGAGSRSASSCSKSGGSPSGTSTTCCSTFLGDVVCGGFGTPIARSMADKLIIVCSNEGQSMYAANNIASAVRYFAEQGGKTRVPGPVRQQRRRQRQSRPDGRVARRSGARFAAAAPAGRSDGATACRHPQIAERGRQSDRRDRPRRRGRARTQVDFLEFMCRCTGNAPKMDGTAVTRRRAVVAGRRRDRSARRLPNGGALDHRYLEARTTPRSSLGPTSSRSAAARSRPAPGSA